MEHYVYVQGMDGCPLMPTTRYGKVRRMLKSGLAEVVISVPFTIRLKYQPENNVVQVVLAGEDPGRTNIGLAAVREDGKCLYLSHTTTRNKEIPRLMDNRREKRQASRRGERLRRKRRAAKCGTILLRFKDTPMGKRPVMCYDAKQGRFHSCVVRYLPHYGKPVVPREITNTEAKFLNRKREPGWLTPTATQLLRTHLQAFELICQILPVTGACVETNKFAFMALENPDAKGLDFQNGKLKGFSGPKEAVSAMQNGKCLLCGKHEIEHYHHMLPRHLGGGDTVDNLAGLCNACHTKAHTDTKAKESLFKKHRGRNKKYGALSVLNQIIPYLVKELCKRFPGQAYVTTGYNTKIIRESFGLDKQHELDAYCIAMSPLRGTGAGLSSGFPVTHEIKQFRRHNRAMIHAQRERTYKLDGEIVAKNRRKRMGQTDKGTVNIQPYDSLEEWYLKQTELHGVKESRRLLSTLKVFKSKRIYNPSPKMRKFFPGDTVKYQGKRYVVSGQKNKGEKLQFYGHGNEEFNAGECTLLKRNTGLVYAS